MFFSKRKTYPQEIDHKIASHFFAREMRTDWNTAFNMIQAAMDRKEIAFTREVTDGILLFRFKIADLVDQFGRYVPLSPKKIKKQLEKIASP